MAEVKKPTARGPEQVKTAVLLVAHGSRSGAPDDLLQRLSAVIHRPGGSLLVETAYCQWQQPDLPRGIERCVGAGARRILLYPCFLLTGKHVSRDLPAAVATAARLYPRVEFHLGQPLGADPELGALVSAGITEQLVAAGWGK